MYQLLGLDNKESVGQREIGTKAPFSFDGRVFVFNTIRSSRVKSITIDDCIMTVRTKNSEYKFKKVI